MEVKFILQSGLLHCWISSSLLSGAAAVQRELLSARFSGGGDAKIVINAGKTGESQ